MRTSAGSTCVSRSTTCGHGLRAETTPDNLALACFHCNRRKSDRGSAMDPESGESAPLFDPRQDRWAQHFRWASDRIRLVGVTPTGRATVEALQMNRERTLQVREADLAIGRHPPPSDPVDTLTPR